MAEDQSRQPDTELIPQLLDAYGDRLLRLCTLYLRDVHLAEDALQDTMLRAWRARDTYRGEGDVTWITQIAVNVCKDYLRSPWKRRRAAERNKRIRITTKCLFCFLL